MLFISGQFDVAPDGRLPADFAAQCERAMDNVEALLAAAGMTTANIVKLTYYATDAADFAALVKIRQRRWAIDPAPAVTAIAVTALAQADYRIEIEAIAVAPAETVP
jgi:enamine deaminase RidA (YjgF/YER057c/UK114 family)